jgi:excinuclease ABC subunit C
MYSVVMTKEALIEKDLPDAPGVYFFMGSRKEILYIGKATSLRSRVRSYFADDIREKRSTLIEKLVQDAADIEVTVADSVLEALILESNLIRTHKPRFNTDQKDDKSYNHLVITKEEFPRVLVVRGKDIGTRFTDDELSYVFGPFTSGLLFRDALKIIKRIFRFYDTPKPVGTEVSKVSRGIIDFNRQIGLYPQEGGKEEYKKSIRHLRMFFEGKKRAIITELEREMKKLAKEMRFEEANIVKKKIFALTHIEDVSLIKEEYRHYRDDRSVRVEAYDVAHTSGQEMVGVMTVVQDGERTPSEYRTFTIKTVTGPNDPKALSEMLDRRMGHPEWQMPQLIVVDGNNVQLRAAERVLERLGIVIPVVAVVKDEKHRPKHILGAKRLVSLHENAILLANAEAHRFSLATHRTKRRKRLLA